MSARPVAKQKRRRKASKAGPGLQIGEEIEERPGASRAHSADLMEFVRRTPDGAVLTIESIERSVIPTSRIGVQHNSTKETPSKLGIVPNREPGQRGVPLRAAA